MGLYVWGTGCGASELVEQGLDPAKITAFVDSFPGGSDFLGRPVLLPEELPVEDCRLLVITTRHAEAVAARCRQLHIPPERCLFLKDHHTLTDRNAASLVLAREVLGQALLEGLLPRQHMVTEPAQLRGGLLPQAELANDYVRLAQLELLCRRVAAVPGAAAELGVYRGFFARNINRLLPDRRLYLFDSFAGFSAGDGASESFQAAHANITAEAVLSAMPHPHQVVLKPGFFPGSLQGLEERFCLVSLDVDFYDTTLEGLRYFWPRLEAGGYLLLHDWGSPKLPGVARALEQYETELGQSLPAMPLCDVGGSLIACKPR